MEVIINDTIHFQIKGYGYSNKKNEDGSISLNDIIFMPNINDIIICNECIGLNVINCKIITDDYDYIIIPTPFQFKKLKLNIKNNLKINATLYGSNIALGG